MERDILRMIQDTLVVLEDDNQFLSLTLDELAGLEARLAVLGVHFADVLSSATKETLHSKGYLDFKVAQMWTETKQKYREINQRVTNDELDNITESGVWEYREKLIKAEAMETKLKVVLDMLKYTINAIKDRIKVVMAERNMSGTE